jgi:hypothetical protein
MCINNEYIYGLKINKKQRFKIFIACFQRDGNNWEEIDRKLEEFKDYCKLKKQVIEKSKPPAAPLKKN